MNEKFRKAAILIDSLDRGTAEQLLCQLGADEADRLRLAARDLGDIDSIERQEVLDEFFQYHAEPISADLDGVELAGNLAQPHGIASGRSAATVALAARSRSSDVFDFLERSHAAELARLLAVEHPQTIALVLSHIASDHASEVLFSLDKSLQTEVIRRLVDLDEANPEALEAVKRNLETKLQTHLECRQRRAAGLATVRQIFRAAGPLAEHELRLNLENRDADLASLVSEPGMSRKKSAVTDVMEIDFASLGELSDADLLQVVNAAEPHYLPLALAGATPRFAARILNLLPKPRARAIRSAIKNIGTLPFSDIDEAQSELSRVAGRLMAADRSNRSAKTTRKVHTPL